MQEENDEDIDRRPGQVEDGMDARPVTNCRKVSKSRKVWLVGAGPGDPELLTLKAVKALGAAQVILCDDLVHDDVLAVRERLQSRAHRIAPPQPAFHHANALKTA